MYFKRNTSISQISRKIKKQVRIQKVFNKIKLKDIFLSEKYHFNAYMQKAVDLMKLVKPLKEYDDNVIEAIKRFNNNLYQFLINECKNTKDDEQTIRELIENS